MIDYIKSFEFASTIALFVYWIPLAICLVVYFVQAVNLYREDVKNREERKHYEPELTIGWILWSAMLSVTPCVNILAMVFSCMVDVFKWLGAFLDIPLVPKKKD